MGSANRQGGRVTTMVSRICENCRSKFSITIHDSKRIGKRYRRFCSRRCSKLGALNPRWKGSDVTPEAGRHRARRRYVTVGPCRICGNPKAERHHKDGNTLNNDPDNIDIVCRRCHMGEDGRLEKLSEMGKQIAATSRMISIRNRKARTHCHKGHEYTSGNTKIDSLGHRQCRTCMRVNAYKYWMTHRQEILSRQKARRSA